MKRKLLGAGGRESCPVHKFEGHKRRVVCHPLGLNVVFEIQVD